MIRKLAVVFVVLIAFSLVVLAQTPAAAAPTAAPATAAAAPVTKIGIINVQAAILATNEGQRDFKNLETKFDPRRTELQNANTEVENLKKQLNTQGDKLNEQARAELMKNIDNKQKVLQRNLEDAQSDWTAQQNDIANRIGSKMLEVLEKYANDNGYAVVLDVSGQQSPVLWASAGTNVTKAIVDAYNAQSSVPPPATSAAATPPAKPAFPDAPKPAAGTTTAKKP